MWAILSLEFITLFRRHLEFSVFRKLGIWMEEFKIHGQLCGIWIRGFGLVFIRISEV